MPALSDLFDFFDFDLSTSDAALAARIDRDRRGLLEARRAIHRKNIDTQLPLDGRAAGSAPPMTEQQVIDLICFLRALTDDDQVRWVAPFSGCER